MTPKSTRSSRLPRPLARQPTNKRSPLWVLSSLTTIRAYHSTYSYRLLHDAVVSGAASSGRLFGAASIATSRSQTCHLLRYFHPYPSHHLSHPLQHSLSWCRSKEAQAKMLDSNYCQWRNYDPSQPSLHD